MSENYKVMKGNEAMAEAALRAGCRFYAGYPITPQSEILQYMSAHMAERGGVFIQGESEIASMSMLWGAAACGERVMSSSSGPGYDLKQEGISYLASYNLPAVIADVMRYGTGDGEITAGQDSYWLATKGGGHGDSRQLVLAPASVQESADLTYEAFDLAEKYRTQVILLSDGNCTQSAVTQTMDSLERELGVKIIDRNYRGARLTAAGERLYPYFEELNSGFDRLIKESKNIREGKDAPVRIGSFSSIASTWLPELMREYKQVCPEVSFDVQIGSDAIAEWLFEDKIDIALADELRCKILKWTPLFEDPFYAVVPQNQFPEGQREVTIEELNQYPFIMAPLDRTEEYVDMRPKKFIKVKCEDDVAVLSMVQGGAGVSVLPDSCLWNIPAGVRKKNCFRSTNGSSASPQTNIHPARCGSSLIS